jgi:lipopolysaccharide export system permease protein
MTLFDRLILSLFGRFTGLALAAFGAIYLLIDFFEKVDDFIEHEAALNLYILYFLNKIPVIVSQLIPLAILMGAFMTLATLSRHGELTAMYSSGLSLFRLTRPILVAAFLVSLGTLFFNEFLLPIHVQKTNQILHQQVRNKKDMSLKLSGVWFREKNAIVNIRTAEPAQKILRGISVFRFDDHFHLLASEKAKEAVFQNGQCIGQKVRMRHFDPHTSELQSNTVLPRENLKFSKKPEDFRDIAIEREEMNFRKLWHMSNQLQEEGYDATTYRVDMHSRLSAPFAGIITAFLGIPFALRGSRHAGIPLGVAISIGVGITYYFVNAILIAFAYSSVLPAIMGAWGANLLFFLLGLYLLLAKQS